MTTNENNFKNKCKNMRELFFGKQDVKTYFDFDGDLKYTNCDSNAHGTYTSSDGENNFEEYCVFDIKLPYKSTDLSRCDKFYELFFSKTQSDNNIDTDGVKYTSDLWLGSNSIECHFYMKYIKTIESKYFKVN